MDLVVQPRLAGVNQKSMAQVGAGGVQVLAPLEMHGERVVPVLQRLLEGGVPTPVRRRRVDGPTPRVRVLPVAGGEILAVLVVLVLAGEAPINKLAAGMFSMIVFNRICFLVNVCLQQI